MIGLHFLRGILLLINDVLEHLPIGEHPVAVQEEDEGRPTEQVHGILGHLVIHGRR